MYGNTVMNISIVPSDVATAATTTTTTTTHNDSASEPSHTHTRMHAHHVYTAITLADTHQLHSTGTSPDCPHAQYSS